MSQEFAFWHYPHEDTGGAQINGQFPLYDRGHIAEVPDAATRSRWAASSKASLILLFDPTTPGPIGASVANTGNFTTLTGDLIRADANGSAAAPAITRASDLDTGLFFPAADQIGLAVGGVERWRQTATGLGIGMTSPPYRLTVGNALDGGWFTVNSTGGVNSIMGIGGHVAAGDGTFQIRFDRSTGITHFNNGLRDTPVERMRLISGLQIGSPTGGDKGAGTLNAVGVYDDNVLLTDLVLDYAEDGIWDREAYAAHPVDSLLQDWMLDPAQYAAAWKRDRHLPLMVSWRDEANRPALGQIVTRQTGELELHAVHIANHENRLAELEARFAA